MMENRARRQHSWRLYIYPLHCDGNMDSPRRAVDRASMQASLEAERPTAASQDEFNERKVFHQLSAAAGGASDSSPRPPRFSLPCTASHTP